VAVSSTGHLYSPVVFDDPHFRFRPYDPLLAYGQSKTAVILFAVGATARWAVDGITANALNPDAIDTNLQEYVGGKARHAPRAPEDARAGRCDLGAARHPAELEGIGGRQFDHCNEAATVDHRDAEGTAVASYAVDPANADRLWDFSEALLDQVWLAAREFEAIRLPLP
jgi:NAD(P)-dependent dehydrogenase (short-subunit alcohol dehydrogenase family)